MAAASSSDSEVELVVSQTAKRKTLANFMYPLPKQEKFQTGLDKIHSSYKY